MAENVGGRGWLVAVCPRKGCAGFRSVETTMMPPSVGKFHRVTCNLCNVAGPSKGTVEDAVDAWNATFAPGRVLDEPREALPFAEARGAAPVQAELTGKCAAYVDCRSCHRTHATEANGMCRRCFALLKQEAQRMGAWVPDSTPTTPSMRAEEHASDLRPRIVALENQLKEPATAQCVSCRVLRRWHCGHGCVKNPGHCCGEFKDMLAEASG